MLSAPIIAGTLPAFYVDEGTVTIAVPFSMNRAVNQTEIKAFSLKLKNVQGSSYLKTLESFQIDFVNQIVYFKLDDLTNFYEGLFYKAQLAYIDQTNTVGYYSTVGVIKYTTKPLVQILNLNNYENNGHLYDYTGTYSQFERDTTEKVHSYCFIVSDFNDNIIADSGWLIHNNSTDINQYESFDTFFFNQDLKEGEKLKITYKVRTNNGLEISSPSYKIMAKKSISSNLVNTKILVSLNFNNGYIDIKLKGEKDKWENEIPVSGYYVLSRASEINNYTQWDEIDKFTLAGQKPSKKNWKDFTIEQGIHYKYSIQQYNDKSLFSERIYSDIIYADYEDCFLFDGTRQLKIKFNPKVSSFKTNHLEAKIDTLGSKYPFIFRNGNVKYKEFPISGLISYHSDEEGLFLFGNSELFNDKEEKQFKFDYQETEILNYKDYSNKCDYALIYKDDQYMSVEDCYNLYYKGNTKYMAPTYKIYDKYKPINSRWDEYTSEDVYNILKKTETFFIRVSTLINPINFDLQKIRSFNLTSDNLQLERNFKLEVLDWLNNGKPKLFKSPVEGNYLVRLMSISLSPNDTTGRMLHTFNSMAYEIADNNYDNLTAYNIINTENDMNSTYLKIMTVPFSSDDNNYIQTSNINYVNPYINQPNYFVAVGEIVPAGHTLNNFSIFDVQPGTKIMLNNELIVIGSTGTYSSNIPVYSLKLPFEKIKINNENDFNNRAINLFIYNKQENKYEIAKKWDEEENYFIPQDIQGSINMSYQAFVSNSFNSILNIIGQDVYQQFIGKQEDLINKINNIQTQVSNVYKCNFYTRPLMDYNNINDNINLLYGYQKKQSYLEAINMPFYKLIQFMDVNNSDKKVRFPDRNLENRTSTNSLIMDIYRDFPLLIESGKLFYINNKELIKVNKNDKYNLNNTYCIIDNFYQIVDYQNPDIYYISKEDYNLFKDFLNIFNPDLIKEFELNYQSWEISIEINNQKIDLTNINSYELKEINLPIIININSGVYCELYYQKQIIDYDVSKNFILNEKKNELYNAQKVLTKQYMESCENETSYIIEKNEVLYGDKSISILYKEYIDLLEKYLQTEEV